MTRLTAAFVAMMLAGACTGKVDDRAARTRPAQDAKSTVQHPRVALSGCVQAGPGRNQYVLRDVRMAPLGEQPSDAMSTRDLGITEGSWVRLSTAGDLNLDKELGRKVSVSGTLQDDGRNTIGTAGTAVGPGEPEPRSDTSRAAANEHPAEKVQKEAGPMGQQSNWNGSVPELAVEKITATGQPCPGADARDRR